MNQDFLSERLFEALINGNRGEARRTIEQAKETLGSAQGVLTEVLWPTHEHVEKLFKTDQMTRLAYQMATRILRQIVDTLGGQLDCRPSNGKTVAVFSGTTHGEEVGAQMAVDMLEAAGFSVQFAGGGIAHDEIVAHVNATQPHALVLFSSSASDLPGIRVIVDTLRDINGSPDTKLVVGGGVFNRARGLAEEMGIDVYVPDPLELAVALLGGERASRAAGLSIEQKPAKLKLRRAA